MDTEKEIEKIKDRLMVLEMKARSSRNYYIRFAVIILICVLVYFLVGVYGMNFGNIPELKW
ncbi:hypothetical protein [Paenibacillus antarcticus]|uniref:Uncharacterized protein n=1 Tax=Paenibacillus antarcticus TaxID=253703 RepID=A0A168NAC0_9BACL|nr:hypothetical protein [Paenibacillus antarcticus]OAB45574.1 hypothetical protein PBAT_11665 [Paenibacillus antarcticus]